MSFVGTAIAIGAGTGLIGSAISANAAGNAASQQQQGEANALDFQKQVYGQTQANEAPYLAEGQTGLTDLNAALPSLTQGFDPTAAGVPAQFNFDPTNLQNTAGYQFAVDQGDQGIERAAAASGGIGGGALKALDQYNVGEANQNESNIFNQQLGTYGTNYTNAYNTFESNQANTYARLMGLIGTGQTATGQLANAGQQFANAAGNTAVGSANAAAAGTVGSANAINSGLSGVSSNLTNYALLNQLIGGGGSTPSTGVNAAGTGTASQLGLATPLNPTAALNLQNTPLTTSASAYSGGS